MEDAGAGTGAEVEGVGAAHRLPERLVSVAAGLGAGAAEKEGAADNPIEAKMSSSCLATGFFAGAGALCLLGPRLVICSPGIPPKLPEAGWEGGVAGVGAVNGIPDPDVCREDDEVCRVAGEGDVRDIPFEAILAGFRDIPELVVVAGFGILGALSTLEPCPLKPEA